MVLYMNAKTFVLSFFFITYFGFKFTAVDKF